MADDSGAENLRKQIAFLSNLIDSHKSGNQNEKPVIPNSKQNKTWSKWKSESTLNKNHLDQIKQPIGLSRNSQNVEVHNNVQQLTSQQKSHPGMKYKLHRKLTSTKSAPTIYGHASSSKTTVPTKPPLAGSSSVPKTPFKIIARPPSGGQSNSMELKGNLRWTKDEKISPQKQGLKTTGDKVVSSNSKTLAKNPLSSSSKPLTTTTSVSTSVNQCSSSSHLNTSLTSDRRTVALPKSSKPLTKTTSLLHLSSTDSNHALTSDRRTVALPKSSKPLTKTTSLLHLSSTDSNHALTSDQRTVALPKASKPLTKTTSLSKVLSTNSLSSHSNNASRSSTLDRSVVHLPKNHKSTSKVLNNTNIGIVHSTTSLDRRIVHLPKSHLTNPNVLHNTSKSSVQSITSLDRRTATLPITASNIPTRTTKNNLPNAPVSKGAKLKWRRKSVGQLRNDSSSKNPRSKNLFGNDLQTRIALNAKWRKVKAGSTTLRRTASSSGIRHSRTTVNHLPKARHVFHSQHTKNILHSRTIPRRSRLKWSKSLSQSNLSTKNDQSVRRIQAKFVHKSRFCLKRRKSSEGKVSGMNRDYFDSSRVRTGAINKIKSQNKGFFARRMKYIALGYQNESFTSKHSVKTNARPQLKRKIKIGGSVYLVSSHGKSLKKTVPSKDSKATFSTGSRKNSLHVYRRPSTGSSTNTVNRIFKRQNSVDKKKTRKANKILKRTLQAALKKVKKQKSKSEEYCMFYNKFGKCTKHTQGTCPYIHDPTKIAVCTRFLRGKCQQMDGTCPFSHKIDKEKMPICQYFLKGKCNRDDCAYSHVNVGRQAVVCEDFLKGYCALGFKCKKKHVLECEEFSTTGECPNRSKCKLIHRNKIQQQRKRYFDEGSSPDEEDGPRHVKKSRRKSSDGFLPLEGPAFSEDGCVTQCHRPQEETKSNLSIRIRPNFASRENPDEEQ